MKQYLFFIILFFFPTLQAQTLDGGFVSLGEEKATTADNGSLLYGFAEQVALSTEASELTGISIDKQSVSLTAGKELQLLATVLPDNVSNPTVKWSSSDVAVAIVSEGLVQGRGEGVATITAVSACGLFAADCELKVEPVGTAIDRIESGNKVYPTRVENELYIDLQQPQTVHLLNMAGQICTALEGKAGHNTIRMQSYPPGIYLLRLSGETIKVVKQ